MAEIKLSNIAILSDVGRWLFLGLPTGGVAERIMTHGIIPRRWQKSDKYYDPAGVTAVAVLMRNGLVNSITSREWWEWQGFDRCEPNDPMKTRLLLSLVDYALFRELCPKVAE